MFRKERKKNGSCFSKCSTSGEDTAQSTKHIKEDTGVRGIVGNKKKKERERKGGLVLHYLISRRN